MHSIHEEVMRNNWNVLQSPRPKYECVVHLKEKVIASNTEYTIFSENKSERLISSKARNK